MRNKMGWRAQVLAMGREEEERIEKSLRAFGDTQKMAEWNEVEIWFLGLYLDI